MKVLIIYASSGSGHWKAAEALHEIMRNQRGISVSLIDSLQYTTPLFRWTYPRAYLFLVRYVPAVWGFFYGTLDAPLLWGPVARLRRFLNASHGRRLVQYLREEEPDFILSTHFFASEVAGALKQKGQLRSKLFTVITDFGMHGVWISPGVDGYLVGSEAMKESLVRRGVLPEKVYVIGIPVHPRFEKTQDRAALARQLGLDSERFTVLIASGGFGVGPIERLVSILFANPSLQLLVVCGHNETLFRRLSERFPHEGTRVHLFRFVDNMDELMSVSDCMIGKSGGLTMSEALAKRLPTLILFPIPGQEDANRLFFEQQGAAISLKGLKEVEALFQDLEGLRKKLDRIRRGLQQTYLPQAGERIVHLVLGTDET